MPDSADREFRVTRTMPASREAVFRAWTEPEQIRRWSCPPAGTILDSQVDLEPGGTYRLVIEAEGGTVHTAFGTYRAVDRPKRLVYTWDWEEAESAVGETLVTVDFLAPGNAAPESTEVVVSHAGFPSADAAEGHRLGWTWSLERLESLFR